MLFKKVGTSRLEKEFISKSMVVNDVKDDDDFNFVDFHVVATMRIWLKKIESFQIPS
jgi:hypothetical protein